MLSCCARSGISEGCPRSLCNAGRLLSSLLRAGVDARRTNAFSALQLCGPGSMVGAPRGGGAATAGERVRDASRSAQNGSTRNNFTWVAKFA